MKTRHYLLLAIFTLAMSFTGYFGFDFLTRNWVSETTPISVHLSLVKLKSGKLRLQETKTEKFVTDKFDQIFYWDHDSLAVFIKKGLRGYISVNTGKVIVAPVYSHAWKFSEGLACVTNMQNRLGVINLKGQNVMAFKYKYLNEADYSRPWNLEYVFDQGYCDITDSIFVGLIDASGAEVLSPVFNEIWNESKGYYKTQMHGKWGLYDSTFKPVLEHTFDGITVEEDGLSVEKNGEYSLLSFDGKTILSQIVFDLCYPLEFISMPVDEGYETIDSENQEAMICKGWTVVNNGNGTGLMRDSDQSILIPCKYDEIKAISENLFRCGLQNEMKYIIINSNGKILK